MQGDRAGNRRTVAPWLLSLGILLLPALVAAAPRPKRLVLKHELSSPMVLTDGKGHYLLLNDPAVSKKSAGKVFYGNGKRFYAQHIKGGSLDTIQGVWSIYIGDPRVVLGSCQLSRDRHGGVALRCGNRRTQLTRLRSHEAAPLLKRAKLYGRFWQRWPHVLARDDDGHYYYVDRWRHDKTSTQLSGFRLFIGVRGKMRQQKLRDVVADPSGEIFITSQGRLKLVKGKVSWTPKGAPSVKLVRVDVGDPRSLVMIYRALGPYQSVRLWRPGDDF